MSTATIIITVILGVAGLSAGLVFGFLPMDTRKMTQSHQRLSTILGTVSMGGVIILIFTNQNIASWVLIGALLAGFILGAIPAVHSRAVKRFPYFHPQEEHQPVRRPRKNK